MINAIITWILLVTVVLVFLSGCKTVNQEPGGEPALAPRGHVMFCLDNPDHAGCKKKDGPKEQPDA